MHTDLPGSQYRPFRAPRARTHRATPGGGQVMPHASSSTTRCHDKVSGAESWWSGLVTEVFEALTPCRARKPALCGTARRCPMKGLQIRVWSWSWSSNSKSCAAVAVCAQLPQMIERSAFVRSRRYSSSSLEHDSPADSKIVAGAAILVENGPRATGSIARAFGQHRCL